jgi:hypothetical protein
VTGDVADDQAGAARRVDEGVVPVTADQLGQAGGLVARRQLQVVGLGQQRRQQRPLHGLRRRALPGVHPGVLDHQGGPVDQGGDQVAVGGAVGP